MVNCHTWQDLGIILTCGIKSLKLCWLSHIIDCSAKTTTYILFIYAHINIWRLANVETRQYTKRVLMLEWIWRWIMRLHLHKTTRKVFSHLFLSSCIQLRLHRSKVFQKDYTLIFFVSQFLFLLKKY